MGSSFCAKSTWYNMNRKTLFNIIKEDKTMLLLGILAFIGWLVATAIVITTIKLVDKEFDDKMAKRENGA